MKGRVHYNERGMVSMMVTMIMMLVISMIVLGFAQISRREQRSSLDRQLSTQAFLAAESGVNDARTAIQAHVGDGTSLEKTDCNQANSGPGTAYGGLNYDSSKGMYPVNSNFNVGYTCLLVSTQVDNIHQVISSDGTSTTVPIHPVGSGSLQVLHIQWGIADETQSSSNSGCKPDATSMPFPVGAWNCDFGVLRLAIVPTGNLNRNALLTGQRVYFLYPTQQGGATWQVNYGGATNGTVQQMKCTDTRCSVDIVNIAGSSDGSYALRLSSVYKDGTVDITATSSDGSSMKLADAQALIDVTGRAQDILRRIQVRMALTATNKVPGYAVQSGTSICKRFTADQTTWNVASDILPQDATNPMCNGGIAPPSGPALSALVQTYCDTNPCDGSGTKDPTAAPMFTVSVTNRSPVDQALIAGCDWDMGDGVPVQTNGTHNKACNPGESLPYTYASNPAWRTCQDVLDANAKQPHDVVLRLKLKAGNGQVSSLAKRIYVPPNC